VSDLPISTAPVAVDADPAGSFPAARADALEAAADAARLAPSVHNTQPWLLGVLPDRLELRADRDRQLAALDPSGRALVLSGGAALLNARVTLAARGFAVQVDRLPVPSDPDLLAVVRPVPGRPDGELAALATAVLQRRSNRRPFAGDELPDAVVRRLARVATEEDTALVPVLSADHRRLVARLTQTADGIQNADPAYRAELRRWTNRAPEDGDGVPARSVRHVEGAAREDLPLRDFDTSGAGGLPEAADGPTPDSLLLLTTHDDDALAWLRCGEAFERVQLELTRLGWAASPVTQAIEVPVTRLQLRSALTWEQHPQVLLRVGHAEASPAPPHRQRDDVVRSPGQTFPAPSLLPAPATEPDSTPATAPRPVPDGRGGTTWR
jgi:nitroreductase